MKNLILTTFCFFAFTITSECQKIENKTIDNIKSNKITIEVDNNPVTMKTWDKSYIEIKNTISIDNNEGNDKHELTISNESDGIVIKSDVRYDELERMMFSKNEKGEQVVSPLKGFNNKNPNGLNNEVRFGYDVEGSFEISIPKDMEVDLKTTFGNIAINGEYLELDAHSVYGLVEAKLDDIDHMQNLYLRATYKIVDLAINNSSSATFSLNTTYGEIFSDLPITSVNDSNKKENKGKCDSGNYTLNDGTAMVNLSATYSNIYIRDIK